MGKLGVVGVLKNGPGPVVLVRSRHGRAAGEEQTGLPYASKVEGDRQGGQRGRRHARLRPRRAHDLPGRHRALAGRAQDRWSGTVVLIGQPAEEAVGGAKAMLDDGLYTRFPKPDYALALHVTHDQPAGTVGYTLGAGPGRLDLGGRDRSGARGDTGPRRTRRRPDRAGALGILDLQTIVSREIDPIDPAVVTVGSIHGGTKHNIIPDEVKLQLTLGPFRGHAASAHRGIDGESGRWPGEHRAPPRRRGRRNYPADRQPSRASSSGSCRSSIRCAGAGHAHDRTPVMA